MKHVVLFVAASAIACASMPRRPVRWQDLEGWSNDDHARAYATFLSSCTAVRDGDLAVVCKRALAFGPLTDADAKRFFEENFRLEPIRAEGDTAGLITGYYVPVFAASRVRTPEFQTPLYGAPRDPAELRYTRAEIEGGALAGKGLEILWVRDPIDAFFAQVQGSARVRVEDGSYMKVEFAAKNAHPYTSIGRVLIERGLVPREQMDMQRLRAWMSANPEAAIELRQQNAAFVFFRARRSSELEQGSGAQGVPLVPACSIAIDHALYPYGTPFFIVADLPIDSAEPTTHVARLMIAMDTGTAITGPARADIYMGVGDEAAEVAGRFKQRGVFTLLVPAPR